MARRRGDPRTLDLLAWEPPETTRRFAPEKVRAASLRASISRAVSTALRETGKRREHIAHDMSQYLGEDVPPNMLDAYASEAREDHVIPLVRFIGLVHATGDQRLLQLLADQFDLAVIPSRFLPAIEDAVLDDKIEELQQRRKMARRSWKGPSA